MTNKDRLRQMTGKGRSEGKGTTGKEAKVWRGSLGKDLGSFWKGGGRLRRGFSGREEIGEFPTKP